MNNAVQKNLDGEDHIGLKITSEVEVRKLQDEVNTLRKKSLGIVIYYFHLVIFNTYS